MAARISIRVILTEDKIKYIASGVRSVRRKCTVHLGAGFVQGFHSGEGNPGGAARLGADDLRPGRRGRIHLPKPGPPLGHCLGPRDRLSHIAVLHALDGWEERREEQQPRGRKGPSIPKAEASVASTRHLSAPLAQVWLAGAVGSPEESPTRGEATQRSHTPRPGPVRADPLPSDSD